MEWYEAEVADLLARWERQPPPPGSAVFYGSSSIRMWDRLAEDFPDLRVVNAGFGGSTLAACAHFFARLIVPLRPAALVVYAGDNDLGDGRSPPEVLAAFRSLLGQFEAAFPRTPFGFLSVKHSPARWPLRDAIEETNRLIRDELADHPCRFYVDLAPHMLGEDGSPRPELYAADGLHLSEAGYRLWKEVVGRRRTQLACAGPAGAPNETGPARHADAPAGG